jgi:hypothetical protein
MDEGEYIEDELIHSSSEEKGSPEHNQELLNKREMNIKRRVYDALNV